MYGHALRQLKSRGFKVDHLWANATLGINYLFDHRLDPKSGLIRVVHPWETGCDNSPRFDGCLPGAFDKVAWNAKKREWVDSAKLEDGAAVRNPGFDVGSVAFGALVAFNARELAAITGDKALLAKADVLAVAIDQRWVDAKRTWGDVCIAGPHSSTEVRTLEALLPVLVSSNPDHVDKALAEIFDPRAFGRPYGPSATAIDEPGFNPDEYWRGPAWPQLTYLLMTACEQRGRTQDARRLASMLVRGAVKANWAEYWNPETGAGRGAIPEGWSTLAAEADRVLQLGSRNRQLTQRRASGLPRQLG